MLVRYRDVRHSRDIDLCRRHATDLNEAVAAIRAAASVDLGDFVRYDYRGRTEMTENRPTTRVSFNILVGPRTEGTVSVDLVVHIGHEREAGTLDALTAYRTLAQATELMARFLNPVLMAPDPGRWIADELRWSPST